MTAAQLAEVTEVAHYLLFLAAYVAVFALLNLAIDYRRNKNGKTL